MDLPFDLNRTPSTCPGRLPIVCLRHLLPQNLYWHYLQSLFTAHIVARQLVRACLPVSFLPARVPYLDSNRHHQGRVIPRRACLPLFGKSVSHSDSFSVFLSSPLSYHSFFCCLNLPLTAWVPKSLASPSQTVFSLLVLLSLVVEIIALFG